MRLSLTASILSIAMAALVVAGCGGQGANNDRGDAEAQRLRGSVSSRGSSPFALLMLTTSNGKTYLIEDSKLSDELRQLEGMTLEVTGIVVGEFENAPVLAVDYYDILELLDGQRPVVGVVDYERSGGGQVLVIRDDNGTLWIIQGDFLDVLAGFRGSKIWAAGNRGGSGTMMRSLNVTEYGVIRP